MTTNINFLKQLSHWAKIQLGKRSSGRKVRWAKGPVGERAGGRKFQWAKGPVGESSGGRKGRRPLFRPVWKIINKKFNFQKYFKRNTKNTVLLNLIPFYTDSHR